MISLPSVYLPIEILTHLLINHHLKASYCVTIVTEKPMHFVSHIPYRYILNQENGNLRAAMRNASAAGCSDYIVRVQEPHNFMIALDNITRAGNARRSDRKIIILPFDTSDEESVKGVLDVLKMRETNFVLYMLLVIPYIRDGECESYDMVTHKFVGTEDMDMPIYLDRWNSCSSLFENNANLFGQDLSDLEGKRVGVACFTYTPYIFLDVDPRITPLGRDGVEVRIMDEFCRWVNCTVEIVRDGGEEWGEVYENYTGIGVLGRVVEDKADFGITALYSWYEPYLYMDFSVSIVRTAVTCIAPSPRLLASWTMPLMPFSTFMWIGFIFTFIYSSLALLVAQQFSPQKIFLTIFGILITQSQPEIKFKSWRIRSVVGWVMLTGLVLDNAYGGGLASTFTIPKYEPYINTIQDVVDRKLKWGATHEAWLFSLILSEDPLIRKLINLFEAHEPKELERLSYTRSFAFSIEKLPAGSFAIGNYITADAVRGLTIMLQNFYYEHCVVMMRKSSLYTEKVNQLAGRLQESGLILAWETQVALKYLDYSVQLQVRLSRLRHNVKTTEPLNFRHLIGVFIMYAIGVLFATIAFIGERTLNRIKTTRRMKTLKM